MTTKDKMRIAFRPKGMHRKTMINKMKNKRTAFTELGKISRALCDLHLEMWAGDNPLEVNPNDEYSELFDVINERLNDVRELLIKKVKENK